MNISITNYSSCTFFVDVILLKGGEKKMKYGRGRIVKSPFRKVRSVMDGRAGSSNGGMDLRAEWEYVQARRAEIARAGMRDVYG